MKSDKIIKNAKIFTSNKENLEATSLVVKDGKFIYVGDEAGLSDYEGDVTDMGGKFIMPGIIDSHVHITTGVGFEYVDYGEFIARQGKQDVMDFMKDYIKNNPGLIRYRFMLERAALNGENITKEELDEICPDSELLVLEAEVHSVWVNSKILEAHGVTDDTPDLAPGLAYYVRENGHLTGNAYESAAWPFVFDWLKEHLKDEQIESAVARWIDFSVNYGVSCVFDAGFPQHNDIHERIYAHLRDLDKQGKLPIYIEGCYVLTDRSKIKEAIEETKRFRREFNTEHLKVNTLKVFLDGTMKIRTAALNSPYEGTDVTGATTFTAEEIASIIKELNDIGLDFHLHTVGDKASRTVLDGVELAKKELKDNMNVKVTCAHLWVQDDADLGRFKELGVVANYTPVWHAGVVAGEPYKFWKTIIGEKRASSMYRSKSVWDTGALVSWSSDDVAFGDFSSWSPYYAMEIGMTRHVTKKTNIDEQQITAEPLPPADEKMSIEEMLIGYTINGAKQLRIDDVKGSIEVGKDADYLVFDNDLLSAEHEGFSHNKPKEVYFSGKRI